MIGQSRLTGPDGEELVLLYDHAARLAAEDAADKPFGDLITGAFAGRLGYLGALLYGGLRRHHPTLTLGQAHDLIGEAVGGDMLLSLQEGMVKAITASMPARDESEEANPPKAPGGTGTRSSAPGAKKGSTPRRSGGRPRAASR
ncbi:hypothetical protein GGQ97_002306 [Sphingomonas kaistensis]|uniref:Gene transfer agent family protein n=1 Tax=Sphingomonas kaistensis TaxID=298708 RepID=A0A7X5Y817_9SPHN|nr:hypothetical protein [Sphingomonas kaistensis]NJC06513.1 hypothetical protein [Sphingomonas kaistensis]